MKSLDLLVSVWQRILEDPDAKSALATLKEDGFPLDHLMPHDARYTCWADFIAAIPFFSNRPSRRQLHSAKTLRKHLPLVKIMRDLAAKASEPFADAEQPLKAPISGSTQIWLVNSRRRQIYSMNFYLGIGTRGIETSEIPSSPDCEGKFGSGQGPLTIRSWEF